MRDTAFMDKQRRVYRPCNTLSVESREMLGEIVKVR
jgi:hypothetical protein